MILCEYIGEIQNDKVEMIFEFFFECHRLMLKAIFSIFWQNFDQETDPKNYAPK